MIPEAVPIILPRLEGESYVVIVKPPLGFVLIGLLKLWTVRITVELVFVLFVIVYGKVTWFESGLKMHPAFDIYIGTFIDVIEQNGLFEEIIFELPALVKYSGTPRIIFPVPLKIVEGLTVIYS